MDINNTRLFTNFDSNLKLDSINSKKNDISTYNDPFEKFFDKAISLLESTNDMQQIVEQKQIDFVTGKNDDIIGLTMAQSRASSAIQFTSQITSKVLTAYQEIMRIPI